MDVVTICYFAAVPGLDEPSAGTDARQARTWAVSDVLDGVLPLAFDHAHILGDIVERLRDELEKSPLATEFEREPFTLSELRAVFEATWGTVLDPGNFQRRLTSDAGRWVTEAARARPAASERGRPARTYLSHPIGISGRRSRGPCLAQQRQGAANEARGSVHAAQRRAELSRKTQAWRSMR